MVNLRVFRDRNFTLGCALISVMGFALYGSAVMIPQLAQQQLGYTATWSGLVLAPGAVLLVMLIPVSSRLMGIIPAKWIIVFGGLCLATSFWYSSHLTPDLSFRSLVIIRASQTIGLAFLFVPISTIAYATLPPELNGDATALFSMFRNVLGSTGISVSTALITDHEQIRQAHLVQHLTPLHEPYNTTLQQVQNAMISHGIPAAEAMQQAEGWMFQQLRTQTAILAYSDVFIITAAIAACIIPFALMLSGVKVQGGGGAH